MLFTSADRFFCSIYACCNLQYKNPTIENSKYGMCKTHCGFFSPLGVIIVSASSDSYSGVRQIAVVLSTRFGGSSMARNPWPVHHRTLTGPGQVREGLAVFVVIQNLVAEGGRKPPELPGSHQRDGHVSSLLTSADPHTSTGSGQGSTWVGGEGNQLVKWILFQYFCSNWKLKIATTRKHLCGISFCW